MTALKRRSLFAALAGLLLAVATGPLPARADIQQEADVFLTTMGNRAISELADTSVGEAERVQRFRALLNENIDLRLVAQQVLARYWRGATEEQRSRFTTAVRETLIVRFLPIFDNYKGESFDVVSTRTSSRDPNVVGAVTNIVTPGGEVAKVEWFLRKAGSKLLIYDFSAEGIRLTTSLQEEYNSVLRQNGGNLDDLIKRIEATLPPTAILN